jgi:hypothetical protein
VDGRLFFAGERLRMAKAIAAAQKLGGKMKQS